MKLAFGQGTAAGSDWVKSLSQQFGFVLNQNNTSNISVTIPSPGGTVFLGLTKAAGYREPDQQSVPR